MLRDVLKINTILTVATEMPPVFPDLFEYKIIEIIDDKEQDLKQHMRDCIRFLEQAIHVDKKRVLVHCAAGVSRSASIVVAYHMFHYNLPFKEAYERVREKRPCINPNDGFIAQLQEFEKELREEGRIK